MASLVKNVIWNSLRIGSNILFPLITFPYTARVLGPAVKGEFEYVTALVAYFILFANLGFPMYGIREVSNRRDTLEELTKSVNSIFSANIVTAIITTVIYVVYCFLIVDPQSRLLYGIVGLSILLSCIQLDWYFQGIEDYAYITKRSVWIKALSLLALFLFVKSQDDLIMYAVINLMGTVGNNFFNLYKLSKDVKLKFDLSRSWSHIKGSSALFVAAVFVSFYTQLNAVMLGSMDGPESVGLFTAANKLVNLILMVITASLSAILPRITYNIANNQKGEATKIQHFVLNIMLWMCIPLCMASFVMADDIILLLAGDQYMAAVPLLKLLSPLIIVITLSNFFGNHVLYAFKKESIGNYCAIGGAVSNLILNLLLIKKYSFIGVGISTLVAEIVVTFTAFLFARRCIKIPLKMVFPVKIILAALCMAFSIKILDQVLTCNFFNELCIKISIGSLVYLFMLCLLNDKTTIIIKEKICSKIRKG